MTQTARRLLVSDRIPGTPRFSAIIPGLALVMLVATACESTTSKLSAGDEQRFAAEGIVRRADDATFRFTRDYGGRNSSWENRRASIIVTKQSLLIHKNEKVGLEITPRSRRYIEVGRDGSRVRIRAGSGRSEEVWSFEPPSDADGWTRDIRAVIKASQSSSNR
jgi:hypothetical protein